MNLTGFLADVCRQVRHDGVEGAREVLYELYSGFLWSKLDRFDDGDFRVFDREWDVLVVLDACRADAFADVAAEFPFLSSSEAVRSAASTSEGWLARTFADEYAAEMARTAYVTGNPFSDDLADPAAFALLDEVWQYAWDDDLGTVPPRPITDAAIHRWRTVAPDRMIVHYMQPHFPSIPNPEYGSEIHLDRVGERWSSVWDRLRRGEVSEAEVRHAYRENLAYVLPEVRRLVTSVDADRVVVTADHANSFGSWGLYGHPPAPIDAIRRVPWCELTARDVTDLDVSPPAADEQEGAEGNRRDEEGAGPGSEPDEAVESKLRDLGYL